MGILFPNRLGLAAGFDKNAVGIDGLAALGFGHVEIGTVTGEPQPGNPTPRLFRLPADRAVVNRMGFNNDGAEVVARRLAARGRRPAGAAPGPVLGVNIGKTKVVPEDDEARRPTTRSRPACWRRTPTTSSSTSARPNTPGLRDLQAVEQLEPLLRAVRRRADEVTRRPGAAAGQDRPGPLRRRRARGRRPGPGLGLDGIIATNTTISRDGPAHAGGRGRGDRGRRALRATADRAVARGAAAAQGRVGERLTLVGVGGITTGDDACARIDAGATLVQGYTAFVYEGPLWPARIVRGLASAGTPA